MYNCDDMVRRYLTVPANRNLVRKGGVGRIFRRSRKIRPTQSSFLTRLPKHCYFMPMTLESAMLRIQLLGSPQILLDEQPITIQRRRARALVFFLAAQAEAVSRERVLTIFWADHERSAAQQLLRTTLHAIRRAIGDALQSHDDRLTLNAEVDVRRLERLAAQPDGTSGELDALLNRSDNEFLSGFSLPDSEPFEDWVATERERLRILAIRTYTRLARNRRKRGEYADARAALDRALDFDPLQEDLQREAMYLHYLTGDRVGAIRRYETLRNLLDDEMGVPPMAETRELYDAIVTDTLEPPPAVTTPAIRDIAPLQPAETARMPFIGRDHELDWLAQHAHAGRLVLIEGEPGIGKTRLATEFADRHQYRCLTGAARELERSLPYQPISGALRDLAANPDWPKLREQLILEPIWMREALRLAPELFPDFTPEPTAPGPADESRLWEGLARVLIAVAQLQPLTLLIDDIQWADATTLGLIGYLVRRAQTPALRILATLRPGNIRAPLSSLLRGLTREGRLEQLHLGRLSDSAITILAERLSPHFTHPLADWLKQNAEGNPYILLELISYARNQGLLLNDGTLNLATLANTPALPPGVYSLIQSRLALLSEPARRVLDAAVAAGREFSFEVVARAAALSEHAALDALDELHQARLVLPLSATRYRFDHSLTLEVAYREVSEPRHRLLHRRVAEALEVQERERLDDIAGLIAFHFTEGGDHGRAAVYALRAGRCAARVAAWAEAIDFFEQALRGSPERYSVLIELGEALFSSGASARAAERFREAIEQAGTIEQRRTAQLALGRALLPPGRYAEVIDLAREIIAQATPDQQINALFLWGTALSLEGADLAGAAERLQEAAALLQQQPAPDPGALARVAFELGGVAAQRGDLVQAVARYREALTSADQPGSAGAMPQETLTWRILARNNLAYHLHLQGKLAEAEPIADAGIDLANEQGMFGLLPYLYSTRGEIDLARGELDAAEAHFRTGLELAERQQIPERIAGLQANLGLTAIRRGQTSLAIHYLSSALARADNLGTQHLAIQIRIWLAPLLPPDAARTTIEAARTAAQASGRLRLLSEIAAIADKPIAACPE
jgi:DNA-binding SARP family transcriptional activator